MGGRVGINPTGSVGAPWIALGCCRPSKKFFHDLSMILPSIVFVFPWFSRFFQDFSQVLAWLSELQQQQQQQEQQQPTTYPKAQARARTTKRWQLQYYIHNTKKTYQDRNKQQTTNNCERTTHQTQQQEQEEEKNRKKNKKGKDRKENREGKKTEKERKKKRKAKRKE